MALIAAITAATYARSIGGEFVSDDIRTVAENPLLDSLAPANLARIFTSFDGPNYMPLKVLSLAIDRQLFGEGPAGHHAVNVLLHVANAIAVYALLLRLGSSAAAALVIALLWAVHPVQVESVAWISERKNVLSTLFFLLAFHVHLGLSDRPRARGYVALVVLFVAALLSKINTIVLPAIIVAYEVMLRRRLRRRDLALATGLLAIGGFFAWVGLVRNPVIGAGYHGNSLAVTLRASATVVPRYLALIVDPSRLSSVHPVPLRSSWLDPPVLASVVLIVALVLATVFLAWRGRKEAFWLTWFGVTLAPMLNLVPFPALMADRYLYIPLVGALAPVVETAARLLPRRPPLQFARPTVAAAAIVLAAWAARDRIGVWHDPLTLWADWALRMPYATADRPYGPARRPREIALLRAALARDPRAFVVENNLGGIAFEESRLGDAVALLEHAHREAPTEPTIALNLGRAYLWSGRTADAARVLEDAARRDPLAFFVHLNLARAYLQLGDLDRAREALERARALQPQPRNWQREWMVLERLERAR